MEDSVSWIITAVAVVLFSFNLFNTRDHFYAWYKNENTYIASGHVSGVSKGGDAEFVSWDKELTEEKSRIKISYYNMKVNSDFVKDDYYFEDCKPEVKYYDSGELLTYKNCSDSKDRICMIQIYIERGKCEFIYIVYGKGERSHCFKISKSIEGRSLID